ncbi:hypothetical protein Sj15T_09550 [Sphingobium sp. TA15]|uniref:Uncharacterized protein n=1 Tax=Sphingobium indicum (strain DSM 16413 / CCM 7287 / MTCC 6362 / UT26 / NBRC 101211 / UT26S) TaxID=452662 RepID=D4Z217_SPHIU|nr:hypothetical protein SJA_C1-18150 [Sphingobium indicum UT26S]BDD65934.1 hypothetical protein Sj15T_09550 [Sphingobium sp. TA15]
MSDVVVSKNMARIGKDRHVGRGGEVGEGEKKRGGGSRRAGTGLYLRKLRSLRLGPRSAVPS